MSRRTWIELARRAVTWLSGLRIRYLAGIYAATIVAIIVIIDTVRRLGLLGRIYDIRYADKAAHFLLYGMLSLLLNLSVFEARPLSNPVPRAVVCTSILAVLIGLEEVSQIWLPLRRASLTDFACSLLGVGVFAFLALKAWKGRSGSARPASPG
jgi:polysaccharide biosynthesis protein VpsQ